MDGGESGDAKRIDLGWRPFLVSTTVPVDIFTKFDLELCAVSDRALKIELFYRLWDRNFTTLSISISLGILYEGFRVMCVTFLMDSFKGCSSSSMTSISTIVVKGSSTLRIKILRFLLTST